MRAGFFVRTPKAGAEEVSTRTVCLAVKLSGKRTATGRNSEKLITAPKEQYRLTENMRVIESLRFKNRER